MTRLHHARTIACGLLFLLSALPAQRTAADESEIPVAVAPKPTEAVKPVAGISVEAPSVSKTHIVVALADPAPRSSISATPTPNNSPLASPAWPAPAKFFTINQILAKRKLLGAEPAHFAAINPTADVPPLRPMQGEEPFGLFTFRAPEGPLWVKWRKVEADMHAEAPALAHCRTEYERCTSAAKRFVAIINEASVRQGRAKLEFVNRRVNAAIRYAPDMTQWHKADVWSAPVNKGNRGSFQTKLGDCEDYAIAKYFALRGAGINASDLRLMLVRDNWVHLDHAVLAVRLDGHWLVLDNRWSRLIEDTDLKQFEPLFTLNDEGVKFFAAPYASKHGITETVRSDDQHFAAGNASPTVSLPTTRGAIKIASLPPVM